MNRPLKVPRFSLRQFRAKKSRYCLVVFTYNEGEKIKRELLKLTKYKRQVDIIISDWGSTDGSLEENNLRNLGIRTLLTKRGVGGLSSQMRIAFYYLLKEKYRGVILIDGNNKDDPSAIPDFIQALDAGFDHIQGSRFIRGGKGVNTPFLRHWGVRLMHAPFISLAAGFNYTDTTNGFRAYSARLLSSKEIDLFRDVFKYYELHYYLSIASAKGGFKIKEIPVTRSYPRGKVPTKIKSLRGYINIITTLFKAVLGFYNPKVS